jgi:hypothetical protein
MIFDDLQHPGTFDDALERLRIRGSLPLLGTKQGIADGAPDLLGKRSQIVLGGRDPVDRLDGLIGHGGIYLMRYTHAIASQSTAPTRLPSILSPANGPEFCWRGLAGSKADGTTAYPPHQVNG